MARDAQLAGDRVQTEYYLQYADHYFRVLEESRSRFEEQQNQRRPRGNDEDEDDDEDDDDAEADGEFGRGRRRDEPPRARSAATAPSVPRRVRSGERNRRERPNASVRANGRAATSDEPRGRGTEGEERISLGVLPPAIGASRRLATTSRERAARRRARKPRDRG